MSYSADDFFLDNVALKMAKLFKDYDSEKETDFDQSSVMEKFLKILKASADGNGYEKFQKELLQAVMNPHGEDISVDEAAADFLSAYSNRDFIIRKLEYSVGNSVISVDYNGIPDDPQ